MATSLNGTTPTVTSLKGDLTYVPHTVLNSNNVTTINQKLAEMNEMLSKVSVNDIKVTLGDKEAILTNVPLENGISTKVNDVPAELALPANTHIEVKKSDDGKTVTASILKEHVMGQLDDTSSTELPTTVNATKALVENEKTVDPDVPETPVTPDDKKPEEQPTTPKDDDKKTETNKPSTSTGTKTNTDKKDNETKSEVKPSDNKSIVSHKTTYVTTPEHDVYLYHENGSQVKGRALGKNTAWLADKLMTLNGEKYLRVATDEWAKLSDGLEVESMETNIVTSRLASLYTSTGKLVKNRALDANTAWKTDRAAKINGQTMYRVASNEWVSANDIAE